jgi:hypothetical protein
MSHHDHVVHNTIISSGPHRLAMGNTRTPPAGAAGEVAAPSPCLGDDQHLHQPNATNPLHLPRQSALLQDFILPPVNVTYL